MFIHCRMVLLPLQVFSSHLSILYTAYTLKVDLRYTLFMFYFESRNLVICILYSNLNILINKNVAVVNVILCCWLYFTRVNIFKAFLKLYNIIPLRFNAFYLKINTVSTAVPLVILL